MSIEGRNTQDPTETMDAILFGSDDDVETMDAMLSGPATTAAAGGAGVGAGVGATVGSTASTHDSDRRSADTDLDGRGGRGGRRNEPSLADLLDTPGRFRNDDGAPVSFGGGGGRNDPHGHHQSTVYCGRSLGTEAIPGSDGRCGPNDGPQCDSCRRYQSGNGRVDLLVAAFPSLTKLTVGPTAAAVAALRSRGGSVECASSFLSEGLGLVRVDPLTAALPLRPGSDPDSPRPPAPVDAGQAGTLAETLGIGRAAAEAALRGRGGDVEAAAAWVLDDPGAVIEAAEEEGRRGGQAERHEAEARARREGALRTAAAAEVPVGVVELTESAATFPMLGASLLARTDDAAVVVTDGHRMVHADAPDAPNGATNCTLCAGAIPGVVTGSYRCQLCGLCEGCVQSGTVVRRCPRLANGTRVHRHPLTYGTDRPRARTATCDLNFEGCLGQRTGGGARRRNPRPIVWSCAECNWDACASCMSRPLPEGYDRNAWGVPRSGRGAAAPGGNDGGDRGEEGPGCIGGGTFDEVAAERGAAARWEGSYEDPAAATAEVVVGTGAVGTTAAVLSPNLARRAAAAESSSATTAGGGQRGVRGSSPLLAGTRLSDDAARALEMYRRSDGGSGRRGGHDMSEGGDASSSGSGSGSGSTPAIVAAADVSHVEDLLHRANALTDAPTTRALCEAVAAGRVGIAGALLLSRSFAPVPPRGAAAAAAAAGPPPDQFADPEYSSDSDLDSDDGGEVDVRQVRRDATDEEIKRCWCGDVIDAETAPDGAVGCLGGHAMHPACAADLLLGGGECPVCRHPLFFARVPGPEAQLAFDHVEAKAKDRRTKEEEKVRREVEELASRGFRLRLNVGDIVRVSDDMEECARAQNADPRSGGWDDGMADSCGAEGRITELIFGDPESEEGCEGGGEGERYPIAVKIQTRVPMGGNRHLFAPIRRSTNYRCRECNMTGPSRQTGAHRCAECSLCIKCCSRFAHRSCASSISWTWDPSLLQLVCRSDAAALWDCSLASSDEAAARAAKELIDRLRAELRAVMAAREAIKAETQFPPKPDIVERELSVESRAAVCDLPKMVSPADWWRARHMLFLAKEWGDSDQARAKRASLYEAIRKGETDTVARTVRRYNASRVAEACQWADAMAETAEYVVEPTAKVHLRAFPSHRAPKTGHILEPESYFHSSREVMDGGGNMWIQILDSSPVEAECRVVVDMKDPTTSRALVGARVRRGKDWNSGDQDGGEGSEGVIVKVSARGKVCVKWDSKQSQEYVYRAGVKGFHDLVFANGTPPPPPQGWLCVSPVGVGSPAIVKRARSSLRCFCCGDGLKPPKLGKDKFSTARDTDIKSGDFLFVAATLEPVVVEYTKHGRIYCSFPTKIESGTAEDKEIFADAEENVRSTEKGKGAEEQEEILEKEKRQTVAASVIESKMDSIVWYRPEDLVLARGKGDDVEVGTENVIIGGHIRSRREVVLMYGGNEIAAKKAWKDAKGLNNTNKTGVRDERQEDFLGFASCSRGHLLHARCFQSALLTGRSCPAPGCSEPLWVPKVRYTQPEDGDACCGGDLNREAEIEALQTANDVVGHAALIVAQALEDGGMPAQEEIASAGIRSPRMCPACCSGPLFNDNCSDMRAHHGQCSTVAMRGQDRTACTDGGVYHVPASEIAGRIMQMSESEGVAEVLPKCPRHKSIVMFNGCMTCGHLFTDTSWDDMPKYDPKARTLLDLEKKKRNAADLLAKQIRTEAAMLQFERDALRDRWGSGLKRKRPQSCADTLMVSSLPPPPPNAHKYKVRGCTPDCTQDHTQDGDCLACGRPWMSHSGHTCREGARGSWPMC